MALIRDLAQQALSTGYLTMEAEEQLRRLLSTRYGLEDLNAFMVLQEAAMQGRVKQESRERLKVAGWACLWLNTTSCFDRRGSKGELRELGGNSPLTTHYSLFRSSASFLGVADLFCSHLPSLHHPQIPNHRHSQTHLFAYRVAWGLDSQHRKLIQFCLHLNY